MYFRNGWKVETLLEGRDSARVKALEVDENHMVDRDGDGSTGGFRKSQVLNFMTTIV